MEVEGRVAAVDMDSTYARGSLVPKAEGMVPISQVKVKLCVENVAVSEQLLDLTNVLIDDVI